MAKETVFVEGYTEFMRAVARTDKDTREKVREALRKSGESVRSDAAVLFTRYDSRSAAGYRTRVMQSGVIVDQRLKRTTGKHGFYGILQMHKALLPALAQNAEKVEKDVVKAMNEVADIFEGEALMDYLSIEGVKPYDGRYEFDLENRALTTREWGWIKRHSGYLPLTIDEGFRGADPELYAAFAVIALHRAGKIDARDAGDMYERFADAPFGATITLEGDPVEEDDADPPALSGNANGSSSGSDSATSSETSPHPLSSSGTSVSDASESPLQRSAT